MEQHGFRDAYRDKIRGGLFGGAVGDALGYPVEFRSYHSILLHYGEGGIQEYALNPGNGLALISDDTQMSLFTANGIIFGDTRGHMRGIWGGTTCYVQEAYKDWLETQTGGRKRRDDFHASWLLDVPVLHCRRAPGNTCLSALERGQYGSMKAPINNSKGCGGIMRVAPFGLYYPPGYCFESREKLDEAGAELAALTHGHSLGYIPAAILTHIVNAAVYGDCPRGDTLPDAVEDAMDAAARLFGGDAHWPELRTLVARAEELSGNGGSDEENIRALGEGWVAEETLAIAVYCALRYAGDFSRGVIAAVNHSGDSDSTVAVTGNILGAWLGYEAIEDKWKKNLELSDVILEIADDLTDECPLKYERDLVWLRKYVDPIKARET